MSDYSNTYTEGTGDTIDTTDFSTEFSAIETAIATKADSASPTLTNPTITGVVDGSVLTAGTAVSPVSGSSENFGSIPSWVKKITIMLTGVSTTGASDIEITLGDSGGIEASGYSYSLAAGRATPAIWNGDPATEYVAAKTNAFGGEVSGNIEITNVDGNIWALSSVVAQTDSGSTPTVFSAGGTKTLTGALTQVQVDLNTGTFDAGTINIIYQ